jgi:diguanylate cyclase (GGDEF)-like protein/PAS domain S-box-containing protein
VVLDTAPEAFVAMDAGGFITGWNRQAELTFGWSSEEAIGRVLADTIIPARYRGQHPGGLQRYLDADECRALGRRLELTALHRDGREFPVEITISVLKGGGTHAFHAFLHDITERKLRERYLAAEHAITVVIAEAETVNEAASRLLERIGPSMGWEFGALWRAEDGKITCRECWSLPGVDMGSFEAASRGLSLERGAGLPGRVMQSGELEFIEDVGADPNFPRARYAVEAGLRAGVGLPLIAHGETLGVIELFTRESRSGEAALLETTETLVAQIARFLSIIAEREELRGRLERLALTDELTGLPNRRAWDLGLDRELARARRQSEVLCVALLDLDHFKRFNDEHGHQGGDSLLREAAGAWGSLLRASDLLARYGGEEFALAFPAWPMEDALVVVERLRAATPKSLTCSAGLAAWDGSESARDLVGRADAALYQAKAEGRDRAVLAG